MSTGDELRFLLVRCHRLGTEQGEAMARLLVRSFERGPEAFRRRADLTRAALLAQARLRAFDARRWPLPIPSPL